MKLTHAREPSRAAGLHLTWALALLIGGCDGCFGSRESTGCTVGDIDGCLIGARCNGECRLFGCGGADDDDGCICADGSSCLPSGVCLPEPPCDDDPALACGDGCCQGDTLCALGACVAPGASCSSSAHCGPGLVCSEVEPAVAEAAVCDSVLAGRCVPAPPHCTAPGQSGCVADCDRDLDVGSAPILSAAAWGSAAAAGDHVVAPPLVVQLDDDDCDGRVDWRDLPDLVFMTASSPGEPEHGRLVFATTAEGDLVEKGSVPPGSPANDPTTQLAASHVSGMAYIVACTEDTRLRAYDATGSERWLSEPLGACATPTIGVIGPGQAPAVVVEGGAVDLIDGGVIATFTPALEGPPLIADVASAPGAEIVGPRRVIDATGVVIADLGVSGSFVAVADLDGDAAPEIVTVHSDAAALTVWQLGPADEPVTLRASLDLHEGLANPCVAGTPGAAASGGPPAVVDANDDGGLDVAIATAAGVVVFDGALLADPAATDLLLAAVSLADCDHGRRGLTAFDFDADGFTELVASDGGQVHVVSTASESIVWSACSPGEPTFASVPVVDLDANGSADLLAFASAREGAGVCDGAPLAGVQRFSHPSGWAGAPRQWLQHQQPLGGIDELGVVAIFTEGLRGVPALPSAPQLTVDLMPGCASALRVRVENVGPVPVRAGALAVEISADASPVANLPIPTSLDPGAAIWLWHPHTAAPGQTLRATLLPRAGVEIATCEAAPPSDFEVCTE